MKPLKLKISGINSFMEEQIIDFAKLTEMGLFGIFGPTGSGKSTILDGITLALYGEIPRAKDLSGIINSNGDKGDIYYEFQIGSKNNQKTYYVSRSFKREKRGNISTKSVKLCDITNGDEPIVLEEKVTSVNNAVVEIIGLKCSDFTRSVVLPQGNFSDFLKLSGKDKRDMLERIFALQEYGTKLAQRIGKSKKSMGEKYNFIEGKLKTYEGISQEQYDNLLEEIKGLQVEYDLKEKQFKEIEKQYEQTKELYALSKEYKEFVLKKENLEKQTEKIQSYRVQYELAQRAKSVQPYVEHQEKLKEEINQKEIEGKGNKEKLEEIQRKLKDIHEKWKVQQDKKDNTLPELLKEKNHLEIAVERLQKVKGLEIQLQNLKNIEKDLREVLELEGQTLEKLEKKIQQLMESIKESQERKEDLKISSQYRQKLYAVSNIEIEYNNRLKQEKEYLQRIKELETREIQPLYEKKKILDEETRKIEIALKESIQNYQRVESEIKEKEHQNMAAILAKDLKHGENCPVCGSQEHPQIIEWIENQEIEELLLVKEKAGNIIELEEEQLEKAKIEAQRLETQITLHTGLLGEKQEEYKLLKATIDHLKTEYTRKIQELNIENAEKSLKELQEKDDVLEKLEKQIQKDQKQREELEEGRAKNQKTYHLHTNELTKVQQRQEELCNQVLELEKEIKMYSKAKDPQQEILRVTQEIQNIEKEYKILKEGYENTNSKKLQLEGDIKGIEDTLQYLYAEMKTSQSTLLGMLEENGFEKVEEVGSCFKTLEEREQLKNIIHEYENQVHAVKENLQRLEKRINGNIIKENQWKDMEERREEAEKNIQMLNRTLIEKKMHKEELQEKIKEMKKVLEEKKTMEHQRGLLEDLEKLFKGNRFVEYISMGQLKYIAKEASQRLKDITRGRYALELDLQGNFIIRDDFNGGVRRGTQTLSGGETFLTSLALALALSSHIQLKGKSPLEFFFLDEGFGTLDEELLEIVINSLERLHSERLSVGLISHVEELKQRLPRKLIVQPARAGISGSITNIEVG